MIFAALPTTVLRIDAGQEILDQGSDEDDAMLRTGWGDCGRSWSFLCASASLSRGMSTRARPFTIRVFLRRFHK